MKAVLNFRDLNIKNSFNFENSYSEIDRTR